MITNKSVWLEIKTEPGEKIEFLGFAFAGKEINVPDIAEKKINKTLRVVNLRALLYNSG